MEKKKIKKVIGIILLILLIIIAIFLIVTFRKYAIIKSLQQNVEEYLSSTNYHIKSVASEDDGTIVTSDYYEKDGKRLAIMERDFDGEISKISIYNNGERTDVFYDNSEGKKAELDSELIMTVGIYDYLETESNLQTFCISITTKIKKVDYKGEECYKIDDFLSPMFLNDSNINEVYVKKDTGLWVKSTMGTVVTEREYEFDNVQDEIFIEPDIGQYELIKNN